MRPLTLHVSALSDAEYTLYTSSLNDLALSIDDQSIHDDAYYENLSIGVREARAWLRGRFSDLPVSDIDTILKQFHPNLGQNDSLSGGQFFAALRLVVHIQGGKPFDRTLAFVQANPVNSAPTPPADGAPTATSPTSPSPPSTTSTPNNAVNPFSHSQPPQSMAPPTYQQASAIPSPNNPFLTRSKTINGPLNSPARPDGLSTSPSKIPPLPPRKAPPPIPFVPPPRHASVLLTQPPQSISNVSMKTVVSAPVPSSSKPQPPPPPTKINHVTSTLMRQSLQASKAAQTMKRAEEELEKERVLSVLKSSSANSMNMTGRNRSASPNKPSDVSSDESSGRAQGTGPPLPRRKRPNPIPSPPPSNASTTASTGSLGEVAGASVGRGGRCRSASRERSTPFHTFGRSSPFAAGGPFGNSSNNPHVILGNSPFRASPSSMMSTPSGSPSRNPVDLPPLPHSPLPGPPPTHPARKNSASASHSHSYSHSHVQPPLPNSFDSVYAAEIDTGLDSYKPENGGGDGAGQGGPNNNKGYTVTPPNTSPDPNAPPRVGRSKSMHYPSPVPILPPRRRRPESVQLTPTSPMESSPFRGRRSPSPSPSPSPFDTPLPHSPRYGGLSRHASLSMPSHTHRREASFEVGSSHSAHSAASGSSSTTPAPSTLSNIQRTLLKLDPQKLQPKLDALQPRLDKVRYKAEAGLSRKGYVNHSTYGRGMWEEGEQGLIGNREDQEHGGDRYGYGRDISDDDEDVGGRRVGSRHDEGRREFESADDLKWPAGEGWKPLV